MSLSRETADIALSTIARIVDPRGNGAPTFLRAVGYRGTVHGRKQFGPLHQMMADWHADNELSSMVIPRGHAKTTIGSVGANAVALILDPSHRILAPSAGMDLACKIVGETRQVLSGDIELAPGYVVPIAEIFPWAVPDNQRGKQGPTEYFNIRGRAGLGREPSMFASSPKSNLAGNRFTRATPDDLSTEQNSRTFNRRQEVIDFLEQLEPIRYLPSSPISMSSTPWAFTDVTHFVSEKEDWAQMRFGCWDGALLLPDAQPAGSGPGPDGTWPLCPSFLDSDEIRKIQNRSSKTFFASQYKCVPIPAENALFPDSALRAAQLPVDEMTTLPKGSGDLLLWDPVATVDGTAPDRNGLILVRVCRAAELPHGWKHPELASDRNVFIVHGAWEIAGGANTARDTIEAGIRESRWPHLRCIWVEDVVAQSFLAPWLKDRGQLLGVEIRGEKIPAKNLKYRLQSLPTAMQNGQLLFPPEFEGRSLLLGRLSEFPLCDFDDLLAAMALMANHWEQWGSPPGMDGDGPTGWRDPTHTW